VGDRSVAAVEIDRDEMFTRVVSCNLLREPHSLERLSDRCGCHDSAASVSDRDLPNEADVFRLCHIALLQRACPSSGRHVRLREPKREHRAALTRASPLVEAMCLPSRAAILGGRSVPPPPTGATFRGSAPCGAPFRLAYQPARASWAAGSRRCPRDRTSRRDEGPPLWFRSRLPSDRRSRGRCRRPCSGRST